MSNWLLRGLVFAAGMVLVRLIQGALINTWETKALLISIVLLTIFVICALVWGYFDGRADANKNPDPDRRDDLAMTWLLAGLLAGVVSGLVTWLIALFYKNLYTEGLLSEISTFAAFTALLIFLPTIIGVALGRGLTDRKNAKAGVGPRAVDESTDTDVFAAVRDDGNTGPIATDSRSGAHEHDAQTSSVATIERDADAKDYDAEVEKRDADTVVVEKPLDDKTVEHRTVDDKTESINLDKRQS